MNILLRAYAPYTPPQKRIFVTRSSAYWGGVIPDGGTKCGILNFVFAMATFIAYLSNKKWTACGKVVLYLVLLLADWLWLFSVFSALWRAFSAADAFLFMKKQNSHMAASFRTPPVSWASLQFFWNPMMDIGSKELEVWEFICAAIIFAILAIYFDTGRWYLV